MLYPNISILSIEYIITDDENIELEYVCHVRKSNNINNFIYKLEIICNEYEYSEDVYSNMTNDTLVKKKIKIKYINNSILKLRIIDSYGLVSDYSQIKITNNNNNNYNKIDFYCGKLRIFNNNNNELKIEIYRQKDRNNNNEIFVYENIHEETLYKSELTYYLCEWFLILKDSSYKVIINDDNILFFHVLGYTTPPSTYLSFKYDQETDLQIIKFKVTDIDIYTTKVYFAMLNFNGGYTGFQATPDMRIGNTKNILISSQWHINNTLKSYISSSNPRNLNEDFGGEGEGIKMMMDFNWKTNVIYTLIIKGSKHIINNKYYLSISRYINNIYVGTSKTEISEENYMSKKILGTDITSFLEDWTNDTIKNGTFYEKVEIYDTKAMNNGKWINYVRIGGTRTNSILDPNNDLFDADYDNNNKCYYLSHGMDISKSLIAINKNINNEIYYEERENIGNFQKNWIPVLNNNKKNSIIINKLTCKIKSFYQNDKKILISWKCNNPWKIVKIKGEMFDEIILNHYDYFSNYFILNNSTNTNIKILICDIYDQIITSVIHVKKYLNSKPSIKNMTSKKCVSNIYIDWELDNSKFTTNNNIIQFKISINTNDNILYETNYINSDNNKYTLQSDSISINGFVEEESKIILILKNEYGNISQPFSISFPIN